ncbi:MAG: Gfo/Idh/MocA family oxidoreductase [Planctomycetota bacterium]
MTTPTAGTAAIRLAFIGAGGIARTHATSLDGVSASVVAAVDPSQEALDAFSDCNRGSVFNSSDALMEAIASGQVEADAIVLCTPPNSRKGIIQQAFGAGLDCLIEKPLATTGAEADAIVALAQANPDRIGAVGYCHRFTPALIEMKRRLEKGEIGRVTRFENVFAFHHDAMSERWFSDPAVSGGGAFIDTGCHSLDAFQYLLGTPEIAGFLPDSDWPGRGESSATALVRSKGGPHAGVAGVILAGGLEPARFQIRLTGTKGAFSYDYNQPEDLLLHHPDGAPEPVTTIKVESHEVRFARQLEAFVKAVAGRLSPREVGLATLEDGARVAHAFDKASA